MVMVVVEALGLKVNLLALRLIATSMVKWAIFDEVKPTKEPNEVRSKAKHGGNHYAWRS